MKSFLRGFVACALALAPADALLAGLPTARACEPRARRCCKPRCTLIEQPPADGVGERLLLLLGELVARSRRIRCPFWRRRAGDAVGAAVAIADFVAARHKSLELPAGLAELLAPAGPQLQKATNLPIEELMTRVATDIEEGQYYISGKLDASIYDDRCFFDGPDPDMPVRSLGRYVDALRGLFDETISRIDLISMHQDSASSFVAHWRLSGALKLPWRPVIKPYLGATRYEICPNTGLIASHTEAWSISALDAFVSTLVPNLHFGAAAAPEAAALREAIRGAKAGEARPGGSATGDSAGAGARRQLAPHPLALVRAPPPRLT